MRQIAISVLSLFIALPAFADARLPVVNLSSAGVSARAAFGEPIVTPAKQTRNTTTVAKKSDTNTSDATTQKRVAARGATPTKTVMPSPSTDSGEQIVAAADVLSPRRPSADLWAHNTSSTVAPLRLPTPDEFSVIRSDDLLPEESLNSTSTNSPSPRATRVATARADAVQVTEPLSELDAQIARLNELQRRADESVRVAAATVAEPAPTPSRVASRRVVARPTATNAAPVVAQNTVDDTDVKLSQMVVPMDDINSSDDVVVRAVKRAESPRIAAVRDDMTKMSPSELRRAFRKTFLSENKHLSTFQIDDRFDVASDMTENAMGFTSARDLSESGGIRPLEIKINFRNDDAALSRDNYNLLTEYAGIVLSNPTRAVQVSIPQSVASDDDARKLAARRLAIIEQVLRDNGISEQRILPVLSARDEDGLVLRMISLDQYETLTKRQRDVFGDTVSKKTYRSMSW